MYGISMQIPKKGPGISDMIRQKGFSKDFPVNLKKKDGTVINSLVTAVTRNDKDGTIIGYEGTIRDITEQKRIEEALRDSQTKLAEAMDLARLVNWEFDVPTGIFTFNDRFYAMFGTTAAREGGYRNAGRSVCPGICSS